MDDSSFAIVEMTFSFGVVLAWLVWELVKTRREIRRDREKAARERSEG